MFATAHETGRGGDAVGPVPWQGSLLALGAPSLGELGEGLRRYWLDDLSWVDVQPGWLTGADELLADLLGRVAWRQRRVTMYGRRLAEPRLTAWWTLGPGPGGPAAVLDEARWRLGERYGRVFDSLGANLYRDGRDSVAWHGDRIRHVADDPVVAILSLGSPRPFLVRPRGGGPSATFLPAAGDLLVMGGRCQQDWEHTVPKVARSGPRLSVMFRHGADAPDDPSAQERYEPRPIVTQLQTSQRGPTGDWDDHQPQEDGR